MGLLSLMEDVVTVGDSAFSSSQVTSITTALTSAVGTVIDTFISVLPVIAVIVGALWGIRFILHTFNKIY